VLPAIEHLIVGLACTGLRIEELLSLRWSGIDLENERLLLTDESGHASTDSSQPRQTKSGRSRSLAISPGLLSVLRDIHPKNGYVLQGPRGGRIDAKGAREIYFSKVIDPLADRFSEMQGSKKFADARFHSFRHYFCSKCANSGVPERIVMSWLGHAISEMIRHYYHLHDAEARQRMCSLDFLGNSSGRSACKAESTHNEEIAGPDDPEHCDDADHAD